MRRLLLVLALAGCGNEPGPAGGASIVLDIPNGMLDPIGFTTVEITLHEAAGDTVRTAVVASNGTFDLGDLDPRDAVSIEAALRSDSGAAVGYGRTAAVVALEAGAAITIPVRRPIVYIAGLSYTGAPPNQTWIGTRPTYSDLATGAVLDGKARLGQNAVMMISAGPQLFAIEQAALSPAGTLTGPATLRAVSTGDHSTGAPLGGSMTGAVLDGAGSDDGTTLVVGTSEKLFAIDTRPGAAVPVRELAAGSFGRVAIVAGADGALGAVAIRNRVSTVGTCTPTAELWWIGSLGGEVIDARMIATGGFADVAADAGRAWYVDACRGELGEAIATGARAVRSNLGTLGRPSALAVANGQAWIGLERPSPTTMTLVVTPVDATSGAPRVLWSEIQDQILAAEFFPGVERRLPAQSSTFGQLEVGAGGDYVAATISGAFRGPAVPQANFPQMDIVTEELRVFDATSGGSIQRYRSWCDGFYLVAAGDIQDWICATTTGQTAPTLGLDHRIGSMAFLFGKK